MCLLFLYVNDDCDEDSYRVIIANNRDELWDRPTKQADFWKGNEHCIGGLDQEPGREGGTWLGASRTGRIGILLNILGYFDPKKKGRGHFIRNYLTSDLDGKEYIKQVVMPSSMECNKFNLILLNLNCRHSEISYFNNLNEGEETLNQGVHVFDNSTLNHPWKKSVNGRIRFKGIVEDYGRKSSKERLVAELLRMLSDRTPNENDSQLASQSQMAKMSKTLEKERSACFVFSPSVRYGTRTHTLLLIDKNNNCEYIERNMITPVNPDNIEWETKSYTFKMDAPPCSKLC